MRVDDDKEDAFDFMRQQTEDFPFTALNTYYALLWLQFKDPFIFPFVNDTKLKKYISYLSLQIFISSDVWSQVNGPM